MITFLLSFDAVDQIDKDGRGPSIWDEFSKIPGSTSDGTDTSITVDNYVKWAEDIELMKSYGE